MDDDEDNADKKKCCAFNIQRSGAHGPKERRPARGLSFTMKSRVITLLEKGRTPSDVLKYIVTQGTRCSGDDTTMPKLKQIQNMKEQLKKQSTSKIGLTTVASLRDWARDHLVETKEDFENF